MLDQNVLAVLLFFFKKGYTARQAADEICEVEGQGAVSERAAQSWFKRFREGDTTLKHRPGSGRRSTLNNEALLDCVESDPSQSLRELSSAFHVSYSTIQRHLHQLGKSSRSARLVPHDLTNEQVEARLTMCKELLANPLDLRFFKRIVTCDESWVYWCNSRRSKQWLSVGEPADPVPKQNRFAAKILLSVFWNFEGPIYYELIPDGRNINSDIYCTQLQHMYEALSVKYPAVINRKRGLLIQDNARAHTSKQTREKIESLDGIEILPHPPYSPDISPSDYHLFRSMAHFMKGKKFDTLDQVKMEVQRFFDSKSKEWYKNGILDLANRWNQVVDYDGLYFP